MELFRFRITRPVLSQPSDGVRVATRLVKGDVKADADALAAAAARYQQDAAAPADADMAQWLGSFSVGLARNGDLISPDQCVALLPADWRDQVGSADWNQLGQQFASDLVNAMQQRPQPADTVEALCRSLLIFDLVEILAHDNGLPAGQRRLKTAVDVRDFASWRSVILPAPYFPANSKAPLIARRPGVTDFYVVQEEWNHYEASELADVINVLPGETFENRIRHAQRVDTMSATTTETVTSQSTEQDQTMSTTLAESSSQDASATVGAQGQVELSGQYGVMHVATNLGAQLQNSQSQSDSKAFSTAYQTVQRATKSVSQTVTTVQSQRTITDDRTYQDHKLENKGDKVTAGMYRWLTEVHYAQLTRYPNRFTLEFEIPEPGAWLRWALENPPDGNWDHPDPGPFTMPESNAPITPDKIDIVSCAALSSRWRIRGIKQPPPDTLTLSLGISSNPSSATQVGLAADSTLSVPNGYAASSWTAQIVARVDPSAHVIADDDGDGVNAAYQELTDIAVTVGGSADSLKWAGKDDVTLDKSAVAKYLTGTAGEDLDPRDGVTTGNIPVMVYTYDKFVGFTCAVNVRCQLMPEAYSQWQQSTFDQIAAAYQALLDAHNLERATKLQQVGTQEDLAGPPALNQARALNELRRMIIGDLLGQPLTGYAEVDNYPNGEPYVPDNDAVDTETIQFFEQALEWENIVYICYPYYWGRRGDGGSLWAKNAVSASSDPVFDQFLNAGSARVVVPARPGFESLMLFYLYTGQIWGGGQPPAPDDPSYLSVAQEIQALQRGTVDGTPVGSSWAVRLPTTLLWAGSDEKTLPRNQEPTIPAPAR
jgi:hypothetical protein